MLAPSTDKTYMVPAVDGEMFQGTAPASEDRAKKGEFGAEGPYIHN